MHTAAPEDGDMLSEVLLPTRITRHADERPDVRVLSFLDSRLEVVESLTYRQLDHRARSVAAQLLERGLGGAPIVLAFPPGLDFVTAFCGCLYAGAIAVPTALARSHRADERLAVILQDSSARCVLTSAEHGADLERRASGAAVPVDVIATDLLSPLADGGPVAEPAARQLAFLQYTSGSTRSPRGVMVGHGNLAANLNSLREVLSTDDESVGISWLPVFHDMGLIAGVLLPMWLGYPTYLMAPTTFIRNPLSWLGAFSCYHGTHGGAPNFAYQACADAASAADTSELDLATWRVAWNGAEPIRPDTLDRFRAQFASNGFRPESIAPAYGLAEATLVVSGGDGSKPAVGLTVDESELHIGQVRPCSDEGPGAKRLVGSGRPGTGIEVRIVRPDVRRVAEQHALGEIWVRSNSVAQGYWHNPGETAETFGACLATGQGPYLRTGDLGFLHDGELFVIGRLKDVIVIRGVNYYPHDIEHTVERSHSALQPDGGAVVGVEVSGRVDLVAVHEVRRDAAESLAGDEVVDAIRRAVAREHQLALQRVVLLRHGGLPKTSSGKVQRTKCRDELGGAVLPILHEWQMSGAGTAPFGFDTESLSQPGVLERQLVDWLQRELSLSELTWRTPLTELGIDSLKGVELVNVLSAAFDHTFPATSMLDHPTVASLAGLIRSAKLGTDTGRQKRRDGHVYSAEQVDALDERELAEVLQRRIDDVLDGVLS
jgi:acyl-CoA synthetase (AMP-forming)/AMP-acid ligase II/acyl carrier protein